MGKNDDDDSDSDNNNHNIIKLYTVDNEMSVKFVKK